MTQLSSRDLDDLADHVTGTLVRPRDADYDEARRVYNGMVDARPAAVVRCTSADDVAAVVRHAAQTGTVLAVRGGGHSVPGYGTADGALVADLSPMDAVVVDPVARTATAGGGATWGPFNDGYFDAMAPHAQAGGYTNFASGDEQPRAAANYGSNHDRLRQVKRRYDPDDLFRLNQNIVPAPVGRE